MKGLADLPPLLRGWTVNVLGKVRRLRKRQFSLQELYEFETELQLLHAHNLNIWPKIRQQLQVLRDIGLIKFNGQGKYTLQA